MKIRPLENHLSHATTCFLSPKVDNYVMLDRDNIVSPNIFSLFFRIHVLVQCRSFLESIRAPVRLPLPHHTHFIIIIPPLWYSVVVAGLSQNPSPKRYTSKKEAACVVSPLGFHTSDPQRTQATSLPSQ